MKVDTMRHIDYYVGVPLCFLGSVCQKIAALLIRRDKKAPKNVLFVELSEMGSAILVDPAMRKLQQETGANLHFAIFKKNKPSLDLLGTVPQDNIYTIREDSFLSLAQDGIKFFFWTRKRKIDAVIDLELFSRVTALLCGFSGAPFKVGFHAYYNEGLYRGDFLSHKVAYNPHIHIAKNFIALVNALMSPKEEIPYSKTMIADNEIRIAKVKFSAQEKKTVIDLVRGCFPKFDSEKYKIILINPNASELLIQRRWPQENYAQLIKMILENSPRAIVLITGDPREREEAQRLKEQVQDDRCINFAGKVTFAQLPLLYSISEFMVTNDSGPPHFAAITDMPTFVIFGPETPALYGSLGKTTPIYAGLACSPCVSAANHRKTACRDNVCLKVIKSAQVFKTIQPDLEKINAQS
ncbi:MAG: glycosyltransferase family 9 protein [Deltaproteobacteria bacterium HGW-Deltaproteobacteria-13]|jgi:ADP-heptose:LPS heptosyltransferase|nr:MAG: glycosyltransferase family 9 protein [Deltaproteobacteria bacterium HGW-Deltaproteobacteria-13]